MSWMHGSLRSFLELAGRSVSSPTGSFFVHAPHHHLKAGNCCRRKSSGFGVNKPDSNASFHLHGLRCRPKNCGCYLPPTTVEGTAEVYAKSQLPVTLCILAYHQHPEPSVSELPLDDFGSQAHSCAQQQVLAPSSVHIQDTFKNGCSTTT